MTAIDYTNRINQISGECAEKVIKILEKMPNNTFTFNCENDIDGMVCDDNLSIVRIKIVSIKLNANEIFVTDEITCKEYHNRRVYSFWNRPFIIDLYDAIENEIDWIKDVMKDI